LNRGLQRHGQIACRKRVIGLPQSYAKSSQAVGIKLYRNFADSPPLDAHHRNIFSTAQAFGHVLGNPAQGVVIVGLRRQRKGDNGDIIRINASNKGLTRVGGQAAARCKHSVIKLDQRCLFILAHLELDLNRANTCLRRAFHMIHSRHFTHHALKGRNQQIFNFDGRRAGKVDHNHGGGQNNLRIFLAGGLKNRHNPIRAAASIKTRVSFEETKVCASRPAEFKREALTAPPPQPLPARHRAVMRPQCKVFFHPRAARLQFPHAPQIPCRFLASENAPHLLQAQTRLQARPC